jgi:hypothetical protein
MDALHIFLLTMAAAHWVIVLFAVATAMEAIGATRMATVTIVTVFQRIGCEAVYSMLRRTWRRPMW